MCAAAMMFKPTVQHLLDIHLGYDNSHCDIIGCNFGRYSLCCCKYSCINYCIVELYEAKGYS